MLKQTQSNGHQIIGQWFRPLTATTKRSGLFLLFLSCLIYLKWTQPHGVTCWPSMRQCRVEMTFTRMMPLAIFHSQDFPLIVLWNHRKLPRCRKIHGQDASGTRFFKVTQGSKVFVNDVIRSAGDSTVEWNQQGLKFWFTLNIYFSYSNLSTVCNTDDEKWSNDNWLWQWRINNTQTGNWQSNNLKFEIANNIILICKMH